MCLFFLSPVRHILAMNDSSSYIPPVPSRRPNSGNAKRSVSMSQMPRSWGVLPPAPWVKNDPFLNRHKNQKAPAQPPAYEPKPPEDFPVKLTLKLEEEDRETEIAKLCSDALTELPLLVQVREAFEVAGSPVKLEKGEMLMLHFIGEIPRVHAVDASDGSELWLPVQAEQEYERLPLDPRLDDKMFMGVTALMQSKPMPSVVRAVEGYGSDDYTECVDSEDIIQISHVEESVRRDGKQKVLIAKNQVGHRLALHKDMDCAYFTTMLSALFLHLSQLVDLDFPQRVRVVEEKSMELRRPKDEKILKLLSYKNEFQVIATRAHSPSLLAIPLTVPVSMTAVPFKEKNTKKCLPPLFLNLNLTWGYTEVGRPELPSKMKGITQPLPEVIRAWLDSYEGKERCCVAAKVSKADMERELKEVNYYNKDLSTRLSLLNSTVRPSVPPRVGASTLPAPPRPPKPKATAPKPTTLKKPPVGQKVLPSVTEKPKKPGPAHPNSAPPNIDTKNIKKFVLPDKSGGDGYEVPKMFPESDEEECQEDDYEVVPDTTSISKDLEKSTTSELKKILQQKEKVIANLREQNENLIDTCKNLEEEKENIRQTSLKHIEEINRLQCEIDRLLSVADQDIYDTISPTDRPLPSLPQSQGSSIYTTPDSLMIQRACLSRTDIEGVADVLRSLSLSRYIEKFKEEGVDGPLLVTLEDGELKDDLGMTGLHARKLLLEVKKRAK